MEVETISGRGTAWKNALSPISVNGYSALQVAANWRALDFLAGNMVSFGIQTFQKDKKIDHAVTPFLTRPNQNQTGHQLFRNWYLHGEQKGNGYIYTKRNNDSEIAGFYGLLPEDVTPFLVVPDDGSVFDASLYYWHEPTKTAFPAADILHYQPSISHDGITGYDPSVVFAGPLGRGLMLEAYQQKWLQKGSLIRGTIEMPDGTSKEQGMEVGRTVKEFKTLTGETDLLLLINGAKLNNQTVSPVDAQLSEQDSEIISKIELIYGFPPGFLDKSSTKYNPAAIEGISEDLIRFTFRPRIQFVEAELNNKLLTTSEVASGTEIRLDTSALLRGNDTATMTVAAEGANQGILTPNEARDSLNLPAIEAPDADKLRTPTHLATAPTYSQFEPILADAAERVDRKATKALENAGNRPQGDRIAYSNVLADQQKRYCIDSLTPIASTVEHITGVKLDVHGIGEKYGAEIRRRAAGEQPRPLMDLIKPIEAEGEDAA